MRLLDRGFGNGVEFKDWILEGTVGVCGELMEGYWVASRPEGHVKK